MKGKRGIFAMSTKTPLYGMPVLAISVIAALIILFIKTQLTALPVPAVNPAEAYPGGIANPSLSGPLTLNEPLATLSDKEKLTFYIGRSFAEEAWVIAPSSTSSRDGLGPLFNARTCTACHIKGGRGIVPDGNDEALFSTIVRLSQQTADRNLNSHIGHLLPDPNYGVQLQPFAIPSSAKLPESTGEATPSINWEYQDYTFPDGEPYQLRKPALHLNKLANGPLQGETEVSIRLASSLMGIGLLEAIPDQAIIKNADENDENHDGISGRPNRVLDIETQTEMLGRFGWKASQPNVRQQTAEAFINNLGITSTIFSIETCTNSQHICKHSSSGSDTGNNPGGTEVNDDILSAVSLFTSSIPVPYRQNWNQKNTLKGREIFYQTGCHKCHTPTFTTKPDDAIDGFSNQTIWPYTDLLLHDLGDGLKDGLDEGLAVGSEWRTAPLWGLAIIKQINPKTGYLHDGRARSINEAILWHQGEALQVTNKYIGLSSNDRRRLIQFIESL